MPAQELETATQAEDRSGPRTAVAALTLYLLLAWAIVEAGRELYDAKAIPILLLAIVAGIAGLTARSDRLVARLEDRIVWIAWLAALLPTLAGLATPPARFIRPEGSSVIESYVLHGVAAVLLFSYLPQIAGSHVPCPGLRRARLAALFLCAAGLGIWIIREVPEPPIDVWEVRQQGAELLLAGESPFAGGIHAVDSQTFDRVHDTYMYPPSDLVVTTLAFALTGDTRWAQWAAVLAAASLVLAIARRRTTPDDPWPELLAAAFLFHPKMLYVLTLAWAEPVALPLLAGTVWLLDRGRRVAAAIVLGLLCSMKQYLVLYLPFLSLAPGIGLTGTAIAVSTAAVTLIPFAAWTPSGLWEGMVTHHMKNPYRSDSLSFTAYLARLGIRIPFLLGFLAAAVVAVAAIRWRGQMAQLLLAASLALLIFFGFGRQAFPNYYYLVCGSAIVAAAASDRVRGRRRSDRRNFPSRAGRSQTPKGR